MSTFIASGAINFKAQCAEGEWGGGGEGRWGGLERKSSESKSREKQNAQCEVIERTGGFSNACGTAPRTLLP